MKNKIKNSPTSADRLIIEHVTKCLELPTSVFNFPSEKHGFYEDYWQPDKFIKYESSLDINIFKLSPTYKKPFYTLVTSGMSSKPMSIPYDEPYSTKYAELMICLPSSWELSMEPLRNGWPLQLLAMLARYPHLYNTFFDLGHTVSDMMSIIKHLLQYTRFSGLILLNPISTPKEFFELQLPDKTIRFFCLVPLYKDELEFLEDERNQNENATSYFSIGLTSIGVTELLDTNRISLMSTDPHEIGKYALNLPLSSKPCFYWGGVGK